jgi:DNA methylase
MDARLQWGEQVRERLDDKVANRWCSFGPYYAMFPISFARKVISTYTHPGDLVLDPFCGRGTSIFCAGESGRDGLGIEINPVGWLYAHVKNKPAARHRVEARLDELRTLAAPGDEAEIAALPEFYRWCFCPQVLKFLVVCRRLLDWRCNRVDSTVMAFVILHLHGRIDKNGQPQALSNQMRQTKSMSQEYSMRWWKEHDLTNPPILDPVAFLKARLAWRYKKGVPEFRDCVIKFGDAQTVLNHLPSRLDGRFQLLLTSPPYSAVTSYYFDQWLRLWMLGDSATPSRAGARWKSRFENRDEYRKLIETVFARAARLMDDDAVIYVRTDAREFTCNVTLEALQNAFPCKKRIIRKRPFKNSTQTALYGDPSAKPGEVDIILR